MHRCRRGRRGGVGGNGADRDPPVTGDTGEPRRCRARAVGRQPPDLAGAVVAEVEVVAVHGDADGARHAARDGRVRAIEVGAPDVTVADRVVRAGLRPEDVIRVDCDALRLFVRDGDLRDALDVRAVEARPHDRWAIGARSAPVGSPVDVARIDGDALRVVPARPRVVVPPLDEALVDVAPGEVGAPDGAPAGTVRAPDAVVGVGPVDVTPVNGDPVGPTGGDPVVLDVRSVEVGSSDPAACRGVGGHADGPVDVLTIHRDAVGRVGPQTGDEAAFRRARAAELSTPDAARPAPVVEIAGARGGGRLRRGHPRPLLVDGPDDEVVGGAVGEPADRGGGARDRRGVHRRGRLAAQGRPPVHVVARDGRATVERRSGPGEDDLATGGNRLAHGGRAWWRRGGRG